MPAPTEPAHTEPAHTDALIVGAGPAALALAAELRARHHSVRIVAPHAPQAFPATYGAWLDDLPGWAQACAAHVWTDVRVYTGPQPTPLLRPYALLDNTRFLHALLDRAGPLAWTVGTVTHAAPDPDGWTVHTREGEVLRARFVVDAAGHAGSLRRPRHPGGAALQTAYGLTARFERPPSAPGGVVWMDYRAPHGPGDTPTFLYAMHLGGDTYFVEETSLIARPAPTRAALRARLHERLRAQGTPPGEILHEEWVAFPMNAAAPDPHGPLAFGAAGGMVHPISGFQVAGALHRAPHVADAASAALRAGRDPHAAAWAALWPPERRAAREVHLLGVQALLNLPPDQLAGFFRAFFALPPAAWHAFLDPDTPPGALARTMLRLFAALPGRTRLPLARAALATPGVSGRALRSAMNAPTASAHPHPAPARQAGGMSDDTRRENAVLNHEDLNQTDTIQSGMQGATGNADANGLDPDVDLGERVEELRENLRPLTEQK
ncbi:lycopene cyclase family protein [Deinococcus sp. JMULE3]|uniref:lycopene cyclase family protein n=1 Tax=Deinococcus sp. JMULE3 TaxID=2518341 RepID=UPI00157732BD|nr:lycopene cyclase family protein [Deinococcus sp. JMULE3]NTY02173.1 lycopene cyclase family protein [Deinococcus sp. JMULE3]